MSTETGMKNHAHEGDGHKRGPTSFRIHDPDRVFDALPLKKGDRFLDVGCGPGDYSIRASECVGDAGLVFALDKDKQMIEELKRETRRKGVTNLRAVTSDITEPLPLKDHCVDVCLMATVLHIPTVSKRAGALFKEIHRVLKHSGCLAIIECKKEETPFGPPMELRRSPEDIEQAMAPGDFHRIRYLDLGVTYLILFSAN